MGNLHFNFIHNNYEKVETVKLQTPIWLLGQQRFMSSKPSTNTNEFQINHVTKLLNLKVTFSVHSVWEFDICMQTSTVSNKMIVQKKIEF